MEYLMQLNDPEYVRKFQEFCGILVTEKGFGGGNKTNTENGTLLNNTCYLKNEVRRRPKDYYKDRNENNNVIVQNGKTTFQNEAGRSPDNAPLGYIIKYKSLYCLAQIGAFLGDETFYFIFYPYFAWNLDLVIARRTWIVWGTVMYLGQRAKDYMQWPRPQAPPVVYLEKCHLFEPAMPSTHAMAGTAMPVVLTTTICTRYEVESIDSVHVYSYT